MRIDEALPLLFKHFRLTNVEWYPDEYILFNGINLENEEGETESWSVFDELIDGWEMQ